MINKIGVLVSFDASKDIVEEFNKIKRLNMSCCQICCWKPELYTEENAKIITDASRLTNIEITALWAGWTGPAEWNFYGGPITLGLLPKDWREKRVNELKMASDFAAMLNVADVITHAGFIPENPNDPLFFELKEALFDVASYMDKKKQYFLFETGQETPTTMLRMIEEIGLSNLGVNFDTANLIVYGKANSVDALEIIGRFVRNTHCKDGLYPKCGRELGLETPLGEGRANFPELIKRFKELGYKGPFVIEREIKGDKQIEDIIKARDILTKLLR